MDSTLYVTGSYVISGICRLFAYLMAYGISSNILLLNQPEQLVERQDEKGGPESVFGSAGYVNEI